MFSIKKVYFVNGEIKLPVLFISVPVFDYANRHDDNNDNAHYSHHNNQWFVNYGVSYKQYGLYPFNAIGKAIETEIKHKVKFFKKEKHARRFYDFVAKRDRVARAWKKGILK